MREAEVLSRIRAIFDGGSNGSTVIVGNGDDGAVLALEDQTVFEIGRAHV